MSTHAILSLMLVLVFLSPPSFAAVERLRRFQRQCYRDISPCVLIMNEQKAFGCAQCGDDVRSEPLREFTSRKELQLFIDGDSEKRIAMIPEFLFFSSTVFASLAATPRNVAALVVYQGDIPSADPSEAGEFPFPQISVESDDDTEPNRFYNYYNFSGEQRQCDSERQARNPQAFCLKFTYFPFNIFRVNASTADQIRALATRFPDQSDGVTLTGPNSTNPVAPRFKMESLGQMYACPSQPSATPTAVDSDDSATETELPITSQQCLKDKTCLPIGGHSLWSSHGHLDSRRPAQQRDILAITAPMDSLAFFSELSLGASAEITSLAVMMAVAEALGKYRRGPGAGATMRRQPVFFAWDAQSWGYAGSARFLKDVQDFECQQQADVNKFIPGCVSPYMPSLKFLDFRGAKFSVLNVGQMISPNETDVDISFKFYAHGRAPNEAPGIVEQAVGQAFTSHPQFGENGFSLGDLGDYTLHVPLDASQSFRRYLPGTDMMTISNYETVFNNSFYHTAFDNQTLTETPQSLRGPMYDAAAALASSVANLAFDAQVSLQVNTTLIDQIVVCITGDWSDCDLAREYLGDSFYNSRSGRVVPGNYAGSFFPLPRLTDMNLGKAAKLSLIRSFFAYHNRYDVEEEENECEALVDCEDFIRKLNERVSPKSQSELRTAVCARGRCVASETHTHNAFGTALKSTNQAQSSFDYDTSKLKESFDGSDPQEAGWTESVWDVDLGLCGFVEDTLLYGGLILLAGLLVLLVSFGLSLWMDRLMFGKGSQAQAETDSSTQQISTV